jgi:GNAT superfamily N-acetyltransferase
MIVRTATREDLLGIGRVAEAAHWTSFSDLLRPDTIGQIIARDFSPSVLARRLLRGGMHVATLHDEVIGFSDGVVETDRVHVAALATEPAMRRSGVGTALLTALREIHADLPVAAAVLLGHLEVEQFFERNGFVPGEVQQTDIFGIEVIERRWWGDAIAEAAGRRATGS